MVYIGDGYATWAVESVVLCNYSMFLRNTRTKVRNSKLSKKLLQFLQTLNEIEKITCILQLT